MPAWGIVQTTPDEFTMYISEHYDWPDNRLRRLTVRRHGFASIHAGVADGVCLTQPLKFTGTELALNYATSAGGNVSVEVQDADGKALMQSNDMFGNELERVVPWLGGARIADLAGKPVRLRLTLRDADVYALRFR
jgi:sugar/nucleoside kinase (ribokinase family)